MGLQAIAVLTLGGNALHRGAGNLKAA